jgi:hypothetical protein
MQIEMFLTTRHPIRVGKWNVLLGAKVRGMFPLPTEEQRDVRVGTVRYETTKTRRCSRYKYIEKVYMTTN